MTPEEFAAQCTTYYHGKSTHSLSSMFLWIGTLKLSVVLTDS